MSTYLDFNDAKEFVKDLGLKTEKEWKKYVKNKIDHLEKKPDNIPSLPMIEYRNDWVSWNDWFGLGKEDNEYLSFEEARDFVRNLKLKSTYDWVLYYQGKLDGLVKPSNIPWNPQTVYENEFIDLVDWIGRWREFEEAQKFVQSLNLAGSIEWKQYCKGELEGYDKKPEDIPTDPIRVYGEDKIKYIAQWLGTERIRKRTNEDIAEVWLPYNEAKKFVHGLGLANFDEWKEYLNDKFENLPIKPLGIPKSPYFVYKDNGWKNWNDWLGFDVKEKIYKKTEDIVSTLKNLLVLYNPYYYETVIEDHLEVLKEKGFVYFGKIKSSLNDGIHPHQNELDEIYKNTTNENYLQLFLTDYSSIYVAKVISVSSKDVDSSLIPSYYDKFDVETWFMIEDMREIIRDDFKSVRDRVLTNFTVPVNMNHTFTIYGSFDHYPLEINMKNEIDYFDTEEDYYYYTDMMKSDLYIQTKKDLIHYNFSSYIFNNLHLNSQESLISAEIEFAQNIDNPLYDFTGVVIKYSKVFELELYLFVKNLFYILTYKNPDLKSIPYSVQGYDYKLSDYQNNKPNLGTTRKLLSNFDIQDELDILEFPNHYKKFIKSDLTFNIRTIQDIRNESAHGETISISECKKIRKILLGIANYSILTQIIKAKDKLLS